jgi:hypothetical protein
LEYRRLAIEAQAVGGRVRRRKVKSMERAVFVYTTYPSVVEAERAGRASVRR